MTTTISPRRHRRQLFQRWLVAAVWLLLAGALAIRLSALKGWIVPLRIASGSMAETLLGPHYELACRDCGWKLRYGVEYPPPPGHAVCANCGFAGNQLSQAVFRAGERVLLDRRAFARRPPRRWELVAFGEPERPEAWSVKRIVGLPGERIAIRNGELYVDGELLRKSAAEQAELAVTVHDSAYTPASVNLPPRWGADSPSGWIHLPRGYRYAPQAPDAGARTPRGDPAGPLDWLTYRHWSGYLSASPRSHEAPVRDNDAYNPGLGRQLSEVRDLGLASEVLIAGQGQLGFLIATGYEQVEVRLEWPSRRVELRIADRVMRQREMPGTPSARFQLAFSVCDRRVRAVVDGRELLAYDLPPPSSPFQPSSRPVACGAAGLTVQLDRLHVVRDIHYLGPETTPDFWQMNEPLGCDEFLLLGDNPALSLDGRYQPVPGISRNLLIGRVLRLRREPHWP